jgi:hypothetical protein
VSVTLAIVVLIVLFMNVLLEQIRSMGTAMRLDEIVQGVVYVITPQVLVTASLDFTVHAASTRQLLCNRELLKFQHSSLKVYTLGLTAVLATQLSKLIVKALS